MARKQGDRESGTLGDKIYYTWRGRQCERSKPTHVANPQTEAQQRRRNGFGALSRLASRMKEAHLVGLHWLAVREKNSTYALFHRLNKDCFTPEGDIDYARVVVSKGSVPGVVITSACMADGVLTVAFDSSSHGGAATDELCLFVYSPAMEGGFFAEPVPRCAGLVATGLPDGWLAPSGTDASAPQKADALHLYAFLRSSRGRTSDTVYHRLAL